MNIIILHGCRGLFMERRIPALLKYYGCKRVIEKWDGKRKLEDGDIALTDIDPPFSIKGAKTVFASTAKTLVTARYVIRGGRIVERKIP